MLHPNDPCTQGATTGQWPFHPFHIAAFQRRVLTYTLYPLPAATCAQGVATGYPFTSRLRRVLIVAPQRLAPGFPFILLGILRMKRMKKEED